MTELKTVKQLASAVSKALPLFNQSGRMLIVPPMEHLLRAVIFDASAYSKASFYLTVFVQPLYEGKNYFFFTFGGRLRAPKGVLWDLNKTPTAELWKHLITAINEQALPFLERFKEPIDLAFACEGSKNGDFSWPTEDINVLEAAGHSWLLGGNSRKALEKFEKAHNRIKTGDDHVNWVKALDKRLVKFIDWLTLGRQDLAIEQLRNWEQESIRELGLERFAPAC